MRVKFKSRMKYYNILIAAFLLFCLNSCGEPDSNGKEELSSTIETVSPKTFKEMLADVTSPQLIDVRTPEEVALGKLEKSVNLNWKSAGFDTQIKMLDTSQVVFVYCNSGGRSAKAARKLASIGFPKVVNMSGGYKEWSALGLNNEP